MNENFSKLATALVKAQAEFKPVPKRGRNPFLKSDYATLDDLIGAVREPLSRHGLAFVQLLGNDEAGSAVLRTILLHESGESIECQIQVGTLEKSQNAIQALGGAITYMRRYSLAAMLGLATGDDSDGEGTEKVERKPAPAKPTEPSITSPKPEPAKPAAPVTNGHARPLAADVLREVIRKKSGWQHDQRLDGEPITPKQIPYTATLTAELFPNLSGDMLDKARHDMLNYLFGVTSTASLTKAEASALIDWTQDQATASVEAAHILEAIAIASGQAAMEF